MRGCAKSEPVRIKYSINLQILLKIRIAGEFFLAAPM